MLTALVPAAGVVRGPGIFASGNMRSGSVKRVASVIGEGSVAVRLDVKHLQWAGQAEPVGLASPLSAVMLRIPRSSAPPDAGGHERERSHSRRRRGVLADGSQVPVLGLGVWQVPDGRECANAVRSRER